MTPEELRDKAVSEVSAHVGDGPSEPRVLHCEAESEWNESLLRTTSEHKLHVLSRAPDMVIFFDSAGREVGWRDDGRTGTARPRPYAQDALRDMIRVELELDRDARIASVKTIELPPLGWTHEALVHLAAVPRPDQVIRVWVSPEDYRVIQCLYGPFTPQQAGK